MQIFLRVVYALSKIRLKFQKNYEVKYISHLDLLRTMNRLLRRSGLLIKYSMGFNPHPLISFALPISVGFTSECEYMDVEFEKEYDKNEIIEKLNVISPMGIKFILEGSTNISFNDINKSKYRLAIFSENNLDELIIEIEGLLSKDEVLVDKKSKKGIKKVNIIPLIFSYDILKNENKIELVLCLAAGGEINLNPELVLNAIKNYIENSKIENYEVHRISLLTKDEKELI